MAFIKKDFRIHFTNFDPISKSDLYTKFCPKSHKNHTFAKKQQLVWASRLDQSL